MRATVMISKMWKRRNKTKQNLSQILAMCWLSPFEDSAATTSELSFLLSCSLSWADGCSCSFTSDSEQSDKLSWSFLFWFCSVPPCSVIWLVSLSFRSFPIAIKRLLIDPVPCAWCMYKIITCITTVKAQTPISMAIYLPEIQQNIMLYM